MAEPAPEIYGGKCGARKFSGGEGAKVKNACEARAQNVRLFELKMRLKLKEYYEIVGESRPLSAFFPKHADFFTEIHF